MDVTQGRGVWGAEPPSRLPTLKSVDKNSIRRSLTCIHEDVGISRLARMLDFYLFLTLRLKRRDLSKGRKMFETRHRRCSTRGIEDVGRSRKPTARDPAVAPHNGLR